MKKIFIFLISFVFIFNPVLSAMVYADAETIFASTYLKMGDYFTLGKYASEPIVWRYMLDDKNGKLMVSTKILCEKAFGIPGVLWKDSFIRKWLNSTISSDEADWSGDAYSTSYMDLHEKGFLHEDNYSELEKNAIRTVTQWTMLPENQINLSENGINTVYNGVKEFVPGSPKDGGRISYYSISELSEHYFGAAYESNDKIFLLDEMQLYHMWKNFGNVSSMWHEGDNNYYSYYLRTPIGTTNYCIYGTTESNQSEKYSASIGSPEGIRPAFYLNEDEAVILSGSGTVDEPYVIIGKEMTNSSNGTDNPQQTEKPSGISVFFNGSEISFDQLPFIENDRVLVPMRAIFEAFGAEVEWNEKEQSVTATWGAYVIKMRIGDNVIMKSETAIESDMAPQVIGDRTFVPLRVIAESLDADVDWIDEEKKVIITKVH